MSVCIKNVEIDFGGKQNISIETGKLAKQADGSAVVKVGNMMLLATVVSAKEMRKDVDFFPLSIDYQEKFASAGRIPGGFMRREAKLSDYEVLICRLVDRALRPLFPDGYSFDTQVNINLISSDPEVSPDAYACLAASAAIAASDIPFENLVSEVKVAKIDGELCVNPSTTTLSKSTLEYIVAGTEDSVIMVEGESSEIDEKELVEAIQFAHDAIKKQVAALKELREKVAKPIRPFAPEEDDEQLKEKVFALVAEGIKDIIKQNLSKKERQLKLKELKEKLIEDICADVEEEEKDELEEGVKYFFKKTEYEIVRKYVLEEEARLDGRKPNEVRAIWSEIDYLPSVHGSAIFTRGETQSLTTVTLGAKMDEQIIDGAFVHGYQKFLLHYNFPGFSTGEVKPNRGPGRREIGHGNLAHRSLKKVLPEVEDNPYTIRVVSDILESNGSSSMATVCAGSLALMDAGIKIRKPVSGIAMGLISDNESGKYVILSDILGDEDHLGDMDFKVTGTADGITACQMDIKIKGISSAILIEALEQAKEGRLHILNEMNKTIDKPREDYKSFAPRIHSIKILKDQIGAVIGPGGKVIQELQKETNTTITVDEVNEEGIVEIFGEGKDAIEQALAKIKLIVTKPELNNVYTGKVKNIVEFGAFVEFLPGKEALLHISEIAKERIHNVGDVLKIGDEFDVKLINIDKQGRYKVSKKALLK